MSREDSFSVLVSGYYGFGNLGDEALLSGLMQGLRPHFGSRLRVLSQRPTATRALHGVGAAHRLWGLPALLRPGALVSGGGGLLQDKTSARSLQYYLSVIGAARRLGHRVVVYGQSVGPLTAAGERSVARALRGVPVAVRDRPSQALLQRLGVDAMLVADPALLLPRPIAVPGARVLLLPRGGYPELTASLARVGRLLHEDGVPLAGLALQPAEDDAPLTELAAQLPSLERLSAATPQAALEHVASSRYVISGRLHGLIFAARARRPFSGLSYDPKVAAFLAEAGGGAHPLAADPAALLQDVARAAFSELQVAELEARAKTGLKWLRETLNRAG